MPDAIAPEVADDPAIITQPANFEQESDHDLFMAALNSEMPASGSDEFMLNAPQA